MSRNPMLKNCTQLTLFLLYRIKNKITEQEKNREYLNALLIVSVKYVIKEVK